MSGPSERFLSVNRSENAAPPDADPSDTTKTSTSRRVAVNAMSNWVAIGARVVLNMYLLSYVFARIGGKEPFGVYRLGVSLSMWVTYLSLGMAGSVVRLASESIASRDWRRLSETMSVARTFLLGAAVLGVGLVVLASFFLLGVLKVPVELRPAAATMFQLTALSGGFHILGILYRGLLQARQRYDLANVGLISEGVLRVGFVVVCFELGWVGLEALGASMAAAAIVGCLMLVLMAHKVLPEVVMRFRRVKRRAARELFGFGAWVAVNQVSQQSLAQSGMPLVSATLGSATAGLYSVGQMVGNYLNRIVLGLTTTLRPVATGYAVTGRREKLTRLYYMGSRFALLMAVPALVVLVTHGKPFLRHWMGVEMVAAYPAMIAYVGMMFGQVIGTSAEHLVLATGRIRGLGLTRLVAAVLGIGLGAVAAVFTDWGLWAVVVGLLAPTVLRNTVYLPLRVKHEADVTWSGLFARGVLPPVIAGLVPAAAGWTLLQVWTPGSLVETLAQMAVAGLVYVPAAWFGVLSSDERATLKQALRRGKAKESPANQGLSAGE